MDTFVEYFAEIVELLGGSKSDARTRAREIFLFETELAKVRVILGRELGALWSRVRGVIIVVEVEALPPQALFQTPTTGLDSPPYRTRRPPLVT